MNQFQVTIGQKIAHAAGAFEQRQTEHGREWIAVFMNEDTIVIALHGYLTAQEKALALSPAGVAQVREFHLQLFTKDSASLFQEIKSITGMEIRNTSAEIDSTLGSVVQIFTTGTVLEKFLHPSGRLREVRAPNAYRPGFGRRDTWHKLYESGDCREANEFTGFSTRNDRPIFTKRISR